MIPGTERPQSYAELLAEIVPRSITSEEEAARIQQHIDRLIDQSVLTADERALLSLLGDLVQAWETDRHQLGGPTPPEAIRALLEAHGLEQQDLVGPVFATRSIAATVLGGKRHPTYGHVERLARFFHVSPSVFYP